MDFNEMLVKGQGTEFSFGDILDYHLDVGMLSDFLSLDKDMAIFSIYV